MLKLKRIIAFLLMLVLVCTCIVSAAKPLTEKTVDIKNVAPQASFTASVRRTVDLVILTSYTGQQLANLQTSVNNLKANLLPLNYDVNINYVTSNKKYGTTVDRLFNYVRRVYYESDWDWKAYHHLSSDSTFIEPYHYSTSANIESIQAYESEFNTLPVRKPGGATFTRGGVYSASSGKYSYERYNVYVNWSNDVKTEHQFVVDIYKNNDSNGVGNEMGGGPKNEKVRVDKSFVRGSYVSERTKDIELLDVDRIKDIPLVSGSDRYLLIVDDGKGKDFTQDWGEYFASIGIDASIRDYIKSCNFKVKAVADPSTLNTYFDKDLIVKIKAEEDIVSFITSDGRELKLGGPYGEYNDYPYEETYVEPAPSSSTPKYPFNIPNIKVKKYLQRSTNEYYVLTDTGDIYSYKIGINNKPTYQVIASGYYDIAITTYTRTNRFVVGVPLNDKTKIEHIVLLNGSYGSTFPGYTVPETIKEFIYIGCNDCIVMTEDNNIYLLAGDLGKPITLLLSDVTRVTTYPPFAFCTLADGTNKYITKGMIGSYSVKDDDGRDYYAIYGAVVYDLEHPVDEIVKTVSFTIPYYYDTADRYRNGFTIQLMIDKSNRMFCSKRYWVDTGTADYENLYVYYSGIYKDVGISYVHLFDGCLPGVYALSPDGAVDVFYTVYPWGTPNRRLIDNVKEMAVIEQVTDQSYGKLFFLLNDGTVMDEKMDNPIKPRVTVDLTEKTYLSFNEFVNSIADSELFSAGAYQQALNKIFDDVQKSLGSSSNYILINQIVDYRAEYSDHENDPEYATRWLYNHDSSYFDNSNGVEGNSGKYIANPISPFTKVGKYGIIMQKRDNPKNNAAFDGYRLWSTVLDELTLYVHRKPIALMRLNITDNGNGTYTVKAVDAGSYDLDHFNSRSDKGIAEREWRWKKSTDSVWTYTQMDKNNCVPGEEYFVQLRVKDIEGVWSDYYTINIKESNIPVALFSVDKNLIRTSDTLKVKDQSFPQSLSSINRWHWIVKKLNSDGSVPSGNIQNAQFANSNTGTGGYDVNVKTNYSSNGVGRYRIYLRVRDSNGKWSDGGTDSTSNINNFYYQDITVDAPPVASFTISNSLLKPEDELKLKDTSTASAISSITKWHWIVKKLNTDGSIPSTNLQNAQFTNSNTGAGGYDINVKTDYSDTGTGRYRIYLRVKNGNGMWSDGGTDSSFTLSNFYSRDIDVDSPPVASFTIEKNPLELELLLKLKDTSHKTGISNINKWHWIVKKLNEDGSVPGSDIQNAQFNDSNSGTGELAGYDANVKTDYRDTGIGTYRIYLRVRNANNMWSDGGTDSTYTLDRFYYQDLVVKESFKLMGFRVVQIKDFHLEPYYNVGGRYPDKPMSVNEMAIDERNFPGLPGGLTKGYIFEFEIDSYNFNDENDEIIIVPHFYTCDSFRRDSAPRELYWEDSHHRIMKVGEGAHSNWKTINLTKENRDIKDEKMATWRGCYLIPGTAWAVPFGTKDSDAEGAKIDSDIIVNFEIKGYKNNKMKYDYNLKQWPVERTIEKHPYEIGDVIRYNYRKNNLDDCSIIINRP
jgi:hypothetical protein